MSVSFEGYEMSTQWWTRPSDKGGARSSRPQHKGGGQSQKKKFWLFGPQSGLKIWGGGQVPQAPPLDPSLAHFVQ